MTVAVRRFVVFIKLKRAAGQNAAFYSISSIKEM